MIPITSQVLTAHNHSLQPDNILFHPHLSKCLNISILSVLWVPQCKCPEQNALYLTPLLASTPLPENQKQRKTTTPPGFSIEINDYHTLKCPQEKF